MAARCELMRPPSPRKAVEARATSQPLFRKLGKGVGEVVLVSGGPSTGRPGASVHPTTASPVPHVEHAGCPEDAPKCALGPHPQTAPSRPLQTPQVLGPTHRQEQPRVSAGKSSFYEMKNKTELNFNIF